MQPLDNGDFFLGDLQWMPPRLEQVHDEAVEEYFSRIDDPEWEDLNLPARHSNGIIIESKL
jgi:3-hydroxyisobutyryl-CoA hydrolase